mmetsp:Transcript_30493/g.93219  ORF Transcript_30493/g.93219 Transcript_30493/m.93219 type:complete len:242 (+) Transcript_30493:676-1401(+)
MSPECYDTTSACPVSCATSSSDCCAATRTWLISSRATRGAFFEGAGMPPPCSTRRVTRRRAPRASSGPERSVRSFGCTASPPLRLSCAMVSGGRERRFRCPSYMRSPRARARWRPPRPLHWRRVSQPRPLAAQRVHRPQHRMAIALRARTPLPTSAPRRGCGTAFCTCPLLARRPRSTASFADAVLGRCWRRSACMRPSSSSLAAPTMAPSRSSPPSSGGRQRTCQRGRSWPPPPALLPLP